MRYQIEIRQHGWRLRDRFWDLTAEFGGIPLEHLTIEEAHVMLGMFEACERMEMEEVPESTTSRDAYPGGATPDAG
jgi:hypothetical protein